ncbi:MAG: phosphotransferase, partial [Planctomycetota bacterium]
LIENAVAARARMVAGRMRNPSVAKDILQISQNCAELLRGRRIPAVVAHGDLRAKHCLILEDGTLTSMLDWGTAREPNLPLFDLIHFIIHDQKQQFGQTLDAVATRALHPRAFAGHEERAIRRYCELLQIDDSVRRACELYYPIEVAATAFLNWDYDRPHWVEVNFSETIRRAAQYQY